jgi:hypothetical protein
MFETPKEVKPSASKGLWLAILAVVLIGGIAGYLFVSSKGKAPKAPASTAAAPAQPAGNADPIHDLKVQRVTMTKDRTGTVAAWLVTIQNKSTVFTYSNIQYETTYVGADNNALLINTGKLDATLVPGDQKNSEIHDALYPAGTAWYKFRITGATSSTQ